MKRERTAVAMRLEKQPDDISKGFIKFADLSMLWTTGRKFGESAFDDAWIAA